MYYFLFEFNMDWYLIIFVFRKILVNRLNNLMKVDKIGRFGNNNYLNLVYWINVVRLVLIICLYFYMLIRICKYWIL